jgi:hypothetical protein
MPRGPRSWQPFHHFSIFYFSLFQMLLAAAIKSARLSSNALENLPSLGPKYRVVLKSQEYIFDR